jgi:hypothetical protein
MKISFDIDDNNLLLDIKAGVFIALLQTELKDSTEYLNNTGYVHPEDKKQYERNIEACKVLLEYYGGSDE